ncbi:MAG TPA: FAD-dependent oxidoreductase [Vicinamibacterales bacterium]|nr:FAD-dependent oxidoreductase [Vicinamibacterales bacterium]
MNRRTLLKTSGLALAGFGVGACRTTNSIKPATMPRPPLRLAPVHVSMDRVIRTTVGLRPHRDGGFVLKAEKVGAKTIIHNYGHGGTGMSLSWGLGVQVAELAQPTGEKKIAVLGAGSPGVSAARQLQRRGYDVTIYAATVPPDTTSNMSWAGFTPTTALIQNKRRTPEWDQQFLRAAEISYRELQLMVGRDYGVYWIDTYNATDDPNRRGGGGDENRGEDRQAGDADLVPEYLRPGRLREIYGPGEHPFPSKFAVRSIALAIEPNKYMDAIVRDFVLFGGRIVIRKFDTIADLNSVPEAVIVNCTGLGSATLFGDTELVPIKGQLTLIPPQPEVNYRANGRMPGSDVQAQMNPRSDGIVIGNLQVRGDGSLTPDPAVIERNVKAAVDFFDHFGQATRV